MEACTQSTQPVLKHRRLINAMSYKKAGQFLVHVYRCTISPFTRPCCRFYPTCSKYALEAIDEFGLAKGSWLTLMRLLRCHPLCEAGVDFIPERFTWFPSRNPIDYHPNLTQNINKEQLPHG